MPVMDVPALEVSDIRATVLRPCPHPYKGEYVNTSRGRRAQAREILRRLIPHVAPAVELMLHAKSDGRTLE
jgi:hypothetical protein